MTIMADWEIKDRCYGNVPMIAPFSATQVKEKHGVFTRNGRIISYGLSSYGYDVRLGRQFKVFTNVNNSVIDPKSMADSCFVDVEADEILIPPNSFALGVSMETIRVPRDVLVICIGKSTYARCGIVCNVTPLEPEWVGQITTEIANTSPLPVRMYAGEGFLQLTFHRHIVSRPKHVGHPMLESVDVVG
jgi:dCTP deaminase